MPDSVARQLELEIQAGYVGPVVSPNPMVKVYGPGPDGTVCKTCKYLVRFKRSRTYLKCDLRPDLTHGAATDQRAGWRSCGRYEAEE